jgi:hypothetical protein
MKQYEQRLRPFLGRKTIVRVDRLEPTKNILRGFGADCQPDKEGDEVDMLITLMSCPRCKGDLFKAPSA